MKQTIIYDDTDLVPRQLVIQTLEDLTIPNETPWRELGFFKTLHIWFYLVLMPFYSVHAAARMTKQEAIEAVRNIKAD